MDFDAENVMSKLIIVYNYLVNLWIPLFLFFAVYIYFKCLRPYKSEFTDKYFKGIPSELNVVEISNLISRKIGPNTLAAYVVGLINRKILAIGVDEAGVEYIVRGSYEGNLSIGDEATVKLILNTMGDGDKVTIEQLHNFCKTKRNRDIMLMEFQIWSKVMRKENYKHIFYETKDEYVYVRLFAIVGCTLFLFNLFAKINNILSYVILVTSIGLFIAFSNIYKRTRQANEEYCKWMAFKAYLEEIENFEEEVLYPEEYVMYGVCLGVKGLERKITKHNYTERLTEALNTAIMKAIVSGSRSI